MKEEEEILADVFYQMVASYGVTEPIEKITSWLLTVARNKIIDWYRKRKPESLRQREDESAVSLDLPDEQRHVFVMHEP